ncbi:MAG: insulinase family protein [Clostridia bacterium]|nr:insulinase family protein [Clostridia bacterium]
MKKWLLTLCLLLAVLAVGCAAAEGLPQVGDTVNGFTVKEIRDFPLIDARIVRFEHDRTGAQAYWIANDDNNRVFDLTFHTVPVDNTGLPHVFEHATLSGSDKYPSTKLFFNLSFQTYNSYMNASTYDIMTSYPVASLSEAQLLKLADFYTDCCFHPIILERESIFRTEAWRYRLNSPEDELTLEGTVYSEMLGSNTLARMAGLNGYRAAFPGSTIGNSYGGEVEKIPDMTWDMLKEYHATYYHPSNCAAYLYGDLEDYGAFLALLDEAFAPYERRETAFDDAAYTPITEPVTVSVPYPMESGSNTSRISEIDYVIVCPDVPKEDVITFEMAGLLLGSETSDLMITLQQALPHGTFSCGVDVVAPSPCVIFTANNVDPEDAETFRSVIDEQIGLAAQNGFSDAQIDAEVAALAISTRLMREESDVGVSSIIPSFAYYNMGTGDPWFYMSYIDELDSIARKNGEGLYTEMIAKYLVGNPRTALVTTYPEAGLKDQQDAVLAEHLAEVKAAMSEEEIAAIVEASNNPEDESADTAAMVASLTAVTKDTLPEEVKHYDINDYTDDNGLRHIETVAGVDGIGQVDVMLNASGIAVEDLHYFRLLTHLVGRLDSEEHSQADLTQLMSRYMYNGSLRCSLLSDPENNAHLFYRMSWIAADEDLSAGYDLAYELAYTLDFSNTEKLLAAVRAIKSGVRNDINGGYMVLLYRAMARAEQTSLLYTYMNQVEYYTFLEQAEAAIEADPEAFVAELVRVREQLRNGNSAIVMYAGSEESIAVNKPIAEAFIARLNNEEIVPVSYDTVPVPGAREGLIIDSNVNYNLIASDFASLGLTDFTGDMSAVTAMVNDLFLMPVLRDQFGAYSVFHDGMDNYGIYLISYRDPKVAEFFQVADQLSGQVAGLEIDQETLDGYILSAYTAYATSSGELAGAVNAEIELLEGTDPDKKLNDMRALKSLTVESIAGYSDVYAKLAETGVRSTAAGASTIQANAEMYDAVLNPLGVVIGEEEAVADVPEDHPHAAAIAAVLDAGAMSAEGGAFRPDEPATVADMAYAFYVLGMGDKPADGASAYETFTQYGLLLGSADPAAELDYVTLNAELKQFLKGGYGFDFTETLSGDGDIATRGELAGILYSVWMEE